MIGLDPEAAGNGSLMRVAPVALIAESESDAMALARLQSAVTHPNRWCMDACAVFAAALYQTLTSGVLPALHRLALLATEPEVAAAIERAQEAAPPPMSGFVLDTLTGALWAVWGSMDFEESVWRATSLGRDADTVAAIAGALAGARWGRAGISDSFADKVGSSHPLLPAATATDLHRLAASLSSYRGAD